MPTETLSPSRAARQVGVPPNTLRSWCRVYGEFLSAGANPPQGEERQLTAQDVEVLRAVAALRANELPIEDIQRRLRDNLPEALQTPLQSPATPTTGVEPMPGTSIAPAPSTALEAFLSANTRQLDDVARRVETVDARLARVESSRNLVLVAVAAFVAGVVLVGVIVWILSLIR